MIQIKSPLRITLAGGGSDLPWWYKKNGGFVISATINKYIEIVGFERKFDNKIWLSYSQKEVCYKIENIRNKIIKECFKKFKIKPGIEIHSISETPGKSGLGSSGSFTSALIKFLTEYTRKKISKQKIAEMACDIEMKNLKMNSGKQDAFISVFGGLRQIKIKKDGRVSIKKLVITKKNLNKFKKSTLSYFTGQTRYSDSVLKSQKKNFINKSFKRKYMKQMVDLTNDTKKFLVKGNVPKIGEIFHKHWTLKKKLSPIMTNKKIDNLYKFALSNGAYGGKLIGAGGGGFLIFIIDYKQKNTLRKKMKKFNLHEFVWDFEFKGIHKTTI